MKKISITLALLSLTSCAFFSSANSASTSAQISAQQRREMSPAVGADTNRGAPPILPSATSFTHPELRQETPRSTVQLMWAKPESPVDGFIVRYGYNAANLEFQLRIPVEALEEKNDSELGAIYHYRLSQIKKDVPAFVSLSSYKNDVESEATPVREIQ